MGFQVGWMEICLASLAAVGMGCAASLGRKSDRPILCNVSALNPIRFSIHDTPATIKRIDVYNKTWECYCEGEQIKVCDKRYKSDD